MDDIFGNLGANFGGDLSNLGVGLPDLMGFSGASLGATSAAVSSSRTDGANVEIPAQIPQQERAFTLRSRGINHIPERGEHAYIKLLTTDPGRSLSRHGEGANAQPTSLGTGSGGVLNDAINGNGGYANFLITDMRCNLEEKLQIVEVFGDAEVSYYFGRQPIQFQFSGMTFDSPDNNWFIEWLEMYTHVMRGSQLARNYELIKIVLPNMTIIGTMSSMSFGQNAQRDVDIPIQFTFLAKQIIPQPVQMPGKPLTNDPVITWDKASNFLSQAGINDIKIGSALSKITDLTNVIKNPLSTVKDFASSMTGIGEGMSSFGSGLGENPFSGLANTDGDISGLADSFGGGDGGGDGGGGSGGGGLGSIGSLSDVFSGVTSNLSGIRASLFSPVYGVLSSLTKLIKNVTGSVGGVVSGFLSPVRDILRDVRNISNQAIGVVNLLNNSINGVTNDITNFAMEVRATVSLLKKTAGVIANAPESVSASMRRLVGAGRLPFSSSFLQSGEFKTLPNGTRINTKMALLSSGKRHTPEQGAKI